MRIDFAIPTKGRHEDLLRGLSIISRLFREERPPDLDVGVCVSDSSGSGLPEDRLSEACQGIRLTYRHSPGIARFVDNLRNAVLLSDAEYIWLLGDDDFILPGALTNVARWAVSGFSLLHVNAILRDSATGIEAPLIARIQEDIPLHREISSKRSVEELTYISCLVFSRELLRNENLWLAVKPGEVASHLRFVSPALVSGDAVASDIPLVVIEKNARVVGEWRGNWCVLIGYEMPRVRDAVLSAAGGLRVKRRGFRLIAQELRMHAILSVFRLSYPDLARDASLFRHEVTWAWIMKRVIFIGTGPAPVRGILKRLGNLMDPRCSALR